MITVSVSVSIPVEVTKGKVHNSIYNGFSMIGMLVTETSREVARTVKVPGPNGKVYTAYNTGALSESIGYAVARESDTYYGDLHLPSGATVPSSREFVNGKGEISLLVSTGVKWLTDRHREYGSYVELGTRVQPARFFISTAISNTFHLFSQLFSKAFEKES